MAPHHWPDHIKQQAERAMADLESFYDKMRECTPFGRRNELHKLPSIRSAIASVSGADGYVMGKLTALDGVCKELSSQRPPKGFDEQTTIVWGLGDVSNIRAQLENMGLLEHYSRPHQ